MPVQLVDRLARFAISGARAGRNLLCDLQHRHLTVWTPRSKGGGASNSDYRVLHEIFESRVRPGDTLVDVGCGRGRVLAYWERAFPETHRVGIELDPHMASAAARAFAGPRCHVIAGDAVDVLPGDAKFIFMFNPFGADHVEAMRLRLEERPPQQPPLRIVYLNPKHVHGFEESSSWSVTRMRGRGNRRLPHHDYAAIERPAAPPEPEGTPPSAY
jgi:SAM-dependent methyltransferase